MRSILAVDPGAAGGLAWKYSGNPSACCQPMPKTESDVCVLIRTFITLAGPSPVIYMETLIKHMGPGIPASTMAVYAENYGIIKGCVIYAGARLELVRPQEWQKALSLGITGRQKANLNSCMTPAEAVAEKKRVQLLNGQLKRDWKNKLKSEAQRLYPHMAEEITRNTADAVMLLEYGIRRGL